MRCYLCKQDNISIIRRKLRYDIRKDVLKCNSCGLVFLRPGKNILDKFYSQDYRKHYSPVFGKACRPEKLFSMSLAFQQERIRRFSYLLNSQSRVLEIGCSAGHFLYSLKRWVKECVGIEINRYEAAFARKKCKIKVFSQPLEETRLPKNYFDLIFLFETLEHLPDPLKTLMAARDYLKTNGHICIQVPNINDALISLYKIRTFADFYFRQPHLFYFSPHTLLKLTKQAGFRGRVSTFQQYNFMNHLHWIFIEQPMPSILNGTGTPLLIKDGLANKNLSRIFNNWFAKIDREYKNLLDRHVLTESLVFVGKKIQS